MVQKPTYEELEQRIKGLEKESAERKRMEEAVRESEELFRNIYQESPIGIEIYDPEGRLLHVNKACLDIFGVLDPKEIKGFRLFEDPNLPDYEKERLHRGETVRYEASFDFELVKKHKLYKTSKSGVSYLGIIFTPFGLKEDKFADGYLVQVVDNTERELNKKALQKAHDDLGKRVKERTSDLERTNERLMKEMEERKMVEEALRESEERYRSLFEKMPIVCFTYDREGRVLSWNLAAEVVYGYTKEEAIGASAYDLIVTPETKEATDQVIQGVFAGEFIAGSEWQDRNKKGEIGWRMGNTFPLLRADGSVECGVNLNIDITDRKRAEEAMREAFDIINRSPAVAFLWKNAEDWPVEFVSDNAEKTFIYRNMSMKMRHTR